MKHLDVSIIIVNWNTRDILCNCLRSIYERTNEIDFEIIVVDNASTDGSVEMVKRDFPHSALIENMENCGFAAANNQGLKIVKGRYVLLLNSDTIVFDNSIAKTVTFADSHLDVAVVGCRVLNPGRTLQPTCFMFPSLLNMFLSSTYLYKVFPRSKFFGREQMTWWDRNDIREVDVVTGCFMLVRREAIEQVGVMDDNFFMYAEETDWCYRFKKAGWKIMFTPDAQIIHFGGQSSKQLQGEMLVRLRLSILRFVNKHYGWLEFQIASFFTVLFLFVRVPFWLIITIFMPKKRLYSLTRVHAYLSGIANVVSGRS